MAHELLEAMVEQGHIDRKQFNRICTSFADTMHAAFKADGGSSTQHEVRRRFTIMVQAFRERRHEGWSVTRILDAMPALLRTALDGSGGVQTPERTIWVPPSR